MRAFHPDEVRAQEHLSVDTRYYLQHQLHAVVSRLCEPIAGLDAAQVAECLGGWKREGGGRRWEEVGGGAGEGVLVPALVASQEGIHVPTSKP